MLTVPVFHKYPNPVFVETGTLFGDGVQAALDAGFTWAISIEISEKLAAKAKKRFESDCRVKIIHGDAQHILGDTIHQILSPITFWLDGHYSGGETSQGEIPDPIIDELLAIEKHPIKTHTIIIDDIRQYRGESPIRVEQLQAILFRINPFYRYRFEDGFVPNDILVAYP